MLNFQMLRQIAESASGMRDRDLWFVVDGESFEIFLEEPVVPAGTVMIPVTAVKDPESTVQVAAISDGNAPVNLMEVPVPAIPPYPAGSYAADAVFWSISAVEKFVLPYYASVYGDGAPEKVRVVLDLLRDPAALGLTQPFPFAIAHLPSSEYTPVASDTGTISQHELAAARRHKHDACDDGMFVLVNGHAEPVGHHVSRARAARQAGAAHATPAAAEDRGGVDGAAAQSGVGNPRSRGSRSTYARMAGR